LLSGFLEGSAMFEIVDSAQDMRVQCLVFDGFYGDPLLNPDTMNAIEQAVERNMSVGLGTNGLLLDENKNKKLVNLTYIRVSLDTYRNDVYNLLKDTEGKLADQIVSNVRHLVELKKQLNKKIRIGLSFLLQLETVDEIEQIIVFSKEIGVDHIQFKVDLCDNILDLDRIQKKVNEGRKHESDSFSIFSDIFIPGERKEKCFVPYFIPVIGPDGGVYTCCEYSYREDKSYGNIHRQSFQDIWFGQRKLDVVNSIDGRQCDVCSRHNWRINNFVNEMK